MPSLADTARARFWRSIDGAQRPGADDGAVAAPVASYDRRRFLQLMGASLALAGSGGCSRAPLEKIVPYRDGPAQQTYGKPVYYATALERDGYARGVLVATQMGRPTKVEGNPRHPGSLGATDIFAQAAVLELWDPDRSQAVRKGNAIATWNAFAEALRSALGPLAATGGEGLRILTETVASPTLHAQLLAVLARYPNARWHQWQPLNRDNAYAGARLAYGEPLETQYRLDRARVLVALDADFLAGMPGDVRYALDFSATRKASATADARSRLYAIESTPTLTGANADRRLALRGSDVVAAAREIATAIGVPGAAATGLLPNDWLRSLVADLQRARGASIVVAGERQPPHVHALAHAINERLGNDGTTVFHTTSVVAEPLDQLASIRELAQALHAGAVRALVVVGANPVYNAPADADFARALERVPFKAHHGLYVDETAARCDWHVPAAHDLERWGDARAFDGTVTLQQPCIAPLYGGRSALEFVAALDGDFSADGHAMLRAAWQARRTSVDAFFDDALRTGIVPDSALPVRHATLRTDWNAATAAAPASGIEIAFAADPTLADGRWANNAWLQELPKPLAQLTWDNAVLLSPALAQRLGVASEDEVEVRSGGRLLRIAAWVLPGVPDESATLWLGHGRARAGSVGDGVGADAYALRTSGAPWFASGATLAKTGRTRRLACTQLHGRMDGREMIRTYTAEQAAACVASACAQKDEHRTLYDSPPSGPYAWAMSIDLSACIGCGACTIACQAENNIPIVGRDEVRNGREMHWIRVDRYFEGPVDSPRAAFQPVPCMQCEHAPCEVVCPVEASVHDAQGINVQVYNRCVGTRFCSNNCPYKVRRFNFFAYADNLRGSRGQRNPEVTVRMRGVMEKCNYCLQRITTAKIAADRDGRALRDGDVVTACQAVCPTRAIVFGDANDPRSEVSLRKRSPLDYALLGELNTRPRTTYLARVTNG